MPRRVAPRYYDTPPQFFPPGADVWEFGDPSRPAPGDRSEDDTALYKDADGRLRTAQGQFASLPTTGLLKDPSPTIYPPRPRSQRASYDPTDRTLRIQFRNGRVYGYYEVPANVWRDLKSSSSTGRFINRRLDPFFEYHEEWPSDLE